MKYTKELPTVPGYYVVRIIGDSEPEYMLKIDDRNHEGILHAFVVDDNGWSYFGDLKDFSNRFEWLSLNDEE